MTPKITKVRARRLVSGPDYSNRALEAEAEVGDSDPQAVLESLESWVAGQLALPTLPRGFTPHDAEVMADDIRDHRLRAERDQARLLRLIGDHECVAYDYGSGGGRQCRFCCAPMPMAPAPSPDENDLPF